MIRSNAQVVQTEEPGLPKKHDLFSDSVRQPHDAESYYPKAPAVEPLGDNLTLNQIQSHYLANVEQHSTDDPTRVRLANSSHLLPRTPIPSSGPSSASSRVETSSSKGKEGVQSDADYAFALALHLREEENNRAWPTYLEGINESKEWEESDNDVRPPSRVFSSSSIPIQPRNIEIRPRGANPAPISIPESVFISANTKAGESDESWEPYDAEQWTAPGSSTRPRPDYAMLKKECIVCIDEKSINLFPKNPIADDCTHATNTCLECIETHIKTELENKVFHDKVVTCPECKAVLKHDAIRRFADPTTFENYASRATDNMIEQIAGLFRCPDAKCNSAQIHENADELPIVTCIGCHKRYCFSHKIAWHESLGCDEYDQFLANPRGFKSRLDIENERAERERVAEQERLKRQEEASRAYIQELLQGEEREAARRRADAERAAQVERERQERLQREANARRAEEARRKLEAEAQQRQADEQANLRTIGRTTKNCPGCRWPIEKNEGCSHMQCIKCRHEFYWCCLANYRGSHARFCLG